MTMARRIPKQIYPKGLQRDYASNLRTIARHTRFDIRPLMRELPDILSEARAEVLRTDGVRNDAGLIRRVRNLIVRGLASAKRAVKRVAKGLAGRVAERVKRYHRKQFERQLRGVPGASVLPDGAALVTIIEGFIAINEALILDIPARTFAEIEGIVIRGVTSGTSRADIAKEIAERLAIGERRAVLIAKDQIGTLYGLINKQRQTEIGVTHFFWQELGDDRVRPLHVSLGGQRFSWKDGAPGEGIPGQPINCRCWGEPDFSTLL